MTCIGRVIEDYSAQTLEQLSVHKNDLVFISQQLGKWYMCNSSGKYGKVPARVVRILGKGTEGSSTVAKRLQFGGSLKAPTHHTNTAPKQVTNSLNATASRQTDYLFGSPLIRVMDKQLRLLTNSPEIPLIVNQLVEFLKPRIANCNGLFRTSPDKQQVRELKNNFEKAYIEDFHSEVVIDPNTSPHVCATVLKLYLYYLPRPLLKLNTPASNEIKDAPNVFAPWAEALGSHLIHNEYSFSYFEGEHNPIQKIRNLIDTMLPNTNRKLLIYMIGFLRHVCSFSQTNNVTAHDLAATFGPVFLPPKKNEDTQIATSLCQKLIENFFGSDSEGEGASLSKTSASNTTKVAISTNHEKSRQSHQNVLMKLQAKYKELQYQLESQQKEFERETGNLQRQNKELQQQLQLLQKSNGVTNLCSRCGCRADLHQNAIDTGRKKQEDELKMLKNQNLEMQQNLLSREQRIKQLERNVNSSNDFQAQLDKANHLLSELQDQRKLVETKLQEKEIELQKVRHHYEELLQEKNKKIHGLERQVSQKQNSISSLENAYKEEMNLRKKYFNMLEDLKGKIRVFCRVRPISGSDSSVSMIDPYTIQVRHPQRGNKEFVFDKIYMEHASQEVVFEEVKNMVQSALDGYNVCIMAYGQTGSGKTHTIMGPSDDQKLINSKVGITPRAVNHVFERIKSLQHRFQFEVSSYMLELYNDTLVDLFAEKRRKLVDKLEIKKDNHGTIFIQNIHNKNIGSSEQLMSSIQEGFSKRKTEETALNEHSSRSHLVVGILIKATNLQTGDITIGKLSLVDLAGSERLHKVDSTSTERLRESQAINKSLTALGHVISSLCNGESHIPYRNNKLTMLMSDSIGGNAKTLMFVCISPQLGNVEETLNSLSYASRVKNVMNKVEKNIFVKEEEPSNNQIHDLEISPQGASTDSQHQELNKVQSTIATEPEDRPKTPKTNGIQSRSSIASFSVVSKSEEETRGNKLSTGRPQNRRAPTKEALKNKNRLEKKEELESKASKPAINYGGFGLLASVGGVPSAPVAGKNVNEAPDQYIDNEREPKLLQVKGRTKCQLKQVEKSSNSLKFGGVFILDLFDRLLIWHSPSANRIEKAKAIDVATRIKDKDRNSRAEIVTIGEDNDEFTRQFWSELGSAMPQHIECIEETPGPSVRSLWRVVEKNDRAELQPLELENNEVVKEILETTDIFVLDTLSEVFLWNGKQSPVHLRRDAIRLAKNVLLSVSNRGKWCKITKLNEGSETVLFREKFSNWCDPLPIQVASVPKGRVAGMNILGLAQDILPVVQDKPFQVSTMLKSVNPPTNPLVDDCKGRITMWKIQEFEKIEISGNNRGMFFSGDSYIVMYTYTVKWKDYYIVYYWFARFKVILLTQLQNEKGTSAYLTVEVDDKISSGAAKQVRVTQNQEPEHFLKIFENQFAVFLGTASSWDSRKLALYHIGVRFGMYYPIEVNPICEALISKDSFVLSGPEHVYIWVGNFASQKSEEAATKFATRIQGSRRLETIKEGGEPESFWKNLEGKRPYSQLGRKIKDFNPRLFHCSTSTGAFTADEVHHFCQDSLVDNDAMILDAWVCVFVWIGSKCEKLKKKKAMEVAIEYVDINSERSPANSPVYLITAGNEPPEFTSLFHGWSYTTTKFPKGKLPLVREVFKGYSSFYSLKELQSKPTELDNAALEVLFCELFFLIQSIQQYLDEEEFKKCFQMSKAEFEKLPKWKQDNYKKNAGLY